MAPNLLSWPPGTVSRFNLLRRDKFCGAETRCVHTDIDCCCKKGFKCCNICSTLELKITAPLCPALDGQTCEFPLTDPLGMVCDDWTTDCDSAFPGECFPLNFSMICDLEACLLRDPVPTKVCQCYKLTVNESASTCCELVMDTWSTSDCQCTPCPYWRFLGEVVDKAPAPECDFVTPTQHCQCCGYVPPSGSTSYPVPVMIEVYDPTCWPPPATMSAVEFLEFYEAARSIQFPEEVKKEFDTSSVPDDVVSWLNNIK